MLHSHQTHIHIIKNNLRGGTTMGGHWLRKSQGSSNLMGQTFVSFLSSRKVVRERGRKLLFITSQAYTEPFSRHLHWIFPAASSRHYYPCLPDEETRALEVCFSEVTQLNKQTIRIWTTVLSDFKLMFHRLKNKTRQSRAGCTKKQRLCLGNTYRPIKTSSGKTLDDCRWPL